MAIKTKIIAGVLALSVVGVGAVEVLKEKDPIPTKENPCVDQSGVEFSPVIQVELKELDTKGQNKRVGALCFKTKQEYETYRADKISKYKTLNDQELVTWMHSPEGQTLDDVLDYEVKKRGGIVLKGVKEEDDLILLIINELQL